MLRWSALIVLGFGFLFMGAKGSPTGGCGGPTACLYNNTWHEHGATFSSTDGCNTCSCDAGRVACTAKACAKACGGFAGITCGLGEYCHFDDNHCGAADQMGVCKKRAGACNLMYDPVCGCDGKTYGNSCSASTAGVSVRHKGVCKWGSCTYNGKAYKDGESFKSKDGCNTCGCSKGKVACTEKACNNSCKYHGKTYSHGSHFKSFDGCNTCYCNYGQVGCTKKWCSGAVCRYNGKVYQEGDKFPAGDGCNTCGCTKDGSVVCTLAVCSCNYKGKTYKEGEVFDAADGCNSCRCSKGQVSCTKAKCPPTSCGSRGLKPCPSGSYCSQPSHCGASDKPGVCVPKPDACPQNIHYVCGCNNKTYSNSCHARVDGVSVQYSGRCKSKPDPTSCSYNGKTYKDGQDFPATDGCNECLCKAGEVLCTKRGCP